MIIKIFKEHENAALIIISLVLSAVLTWYAFPGIFYSDTYQRMQVSQYITNPELNTAFHTTVTFLPVFFMTWCKKIAGNFCAYTFLSSFLYFYISYYAIKEIGISKRWIQYLLFTFNPILFLVSIWNAPDILCGVIILFLIIILSKKLKFYNLIFLFLCSMFIFGYKENSFTILPLIIFYIIYNKSFDKIQKIFCFLSVILGIVVIFVMPKNYNIKKIPLYSGGPSWELLNIIDKLPIEKKYTYTNKISPPDKIQTMINKIHEDNDSVNTFYWDLKYHFSVYNVSKNNLSKDIINAYINVAKDNPKEFLEVKFYFVERCLGLKKPLNIAEYDYNRFDMMQLFGFYDSEGRYNFCIMFDKYAKYSLIRFPYILFLLSAFFLIISKRIRTDKFELYFKIFLFAVFYYAAFLITSHSFEIRYFFPSYYLLFVMNTAIITELIQKYLVKI